MPEPEPQNKSKPARDPQALTSEYHKARKQLMLWSGILFVWSLIGIDLEKAKEAEGNTGALIKSIKSPQAVPWALLIMVGYFIFKLRIEWRQSNENRRRVREAKQDYYSACIVAAVACLLYVGQTISRIQIADAIRSNAGSSWSLFWGFTMFLMMIPTVRSVLRLRDRWRFLFLKSSVLRKIQTWAVWVGEVVLALYLVKVSVSVFRHEVEWRFALVGIFFGSTVGLLVIFFPAIYKRLYARLHKWREASPRG